MSVFKTGTVQIGTQEAPLALPGGGGFTWQHNQGVRPAAVALYDAQGQLLLAPEATYDNSDPDVVEVSVPNPNDVIVVISWAFGTVGAAGKIAVNDPSVALF